MENTSKSGLVKPMDLKIMTHLRKNARETLTRLSRDTGIAISTAFDRLRRLERRGIIRRHTSLFDLGKIGMNSAIVVLLKSDPGEKKNLESWLRENRHVNSLMKINGGWDYVAEAYFGNIRSIEDFLESVSSEFDGVKTLTLYVLEDLKREDFSLEVCAGRPGHRP